MEFRDTRLYELLRWIVAAGIGWSLLVGCFLLIERKSGDIHYETINRPFLNASKPLSEKKETLVASSGYVQIDEIISIDKQLMVLKEELDAASSSLQKKKDIALYLLMFIGLFLMMLSVFVTHSTMRLLLAATGTVFFLLTGFDRFANHLSYSPQTIIVLLLLLASIAYMGWHFLSKKHEDMRSYLFLQIFGAFSLSVALYLFVVAGNEYFFSKSVPEERLELLTYFDEMYWPLEKEQRELLMNEQLSKEQKDRYIELANELDDDDGFAKWKEKRQASLDTDQERSELGYQRVIVFAVFAVLFILLGIFLNIPLLVSFGLLLSGIFTLLISHFLLFVIPSPSSIRLTHGLFVTVVLSFMCYRLYHQRR